jgi:hypothetical protein
MNLNTLSAYRLTQSLYSFSVINSKQKQLDSTVIRCSISKVTTKEEIFSYHICTADNICRERTSQSISLPLDSGF